MSIQDLRIPLIITIAILALIGLLGGSALYDRAHAVAPLEETLAEHPDVLDYEISREEEWNISVRLREVDRMKDAYLELEDEIADVLGNTAFELELKGKNNDTILRRWNDIEIFVYEAAATGHFSRMEREIRTRLSSSENYRFDLQVDEKYIYVQIHGDDGHMYRRIYHGLNQIREEDQ